MSGEIPENVQGTTMRDTKPMYDNGEDKHMATYTDTVSTWAENCDCNGVPNIERARHPLRKLIWLLLVLTGAGFTIQQVYLIFVKYYSYPVSISVNMTFTQTLLFPAVSICNVNQVRTSKLHLAQDELKGVLPHTLKTGDTSALFTSEGRTKIRFQFDNIWAKLDDVTKKELGHQKEDMIIDCSFNGEVCTAADFVHFISPIYGNCYTFNSGWDGKDLHYSHQTGPTHGLTLELFIEQDEYIPEMTETAGIRVTIHDQSKMPFPEDDGMLVSADSMTMLGLTMVDITRKEAPYPSHCWNLSREESKQHNVYSESFPVSYSLTACQKTCYQSHVMGECSCYDPTIPADGAAVRKFMPDINLVLHPCNTDTENICERRVRRQYLNGTLICNCGVACEELLFIPVPSQGIWPNEEFAPIYYEELEGRSPHLANIIQNWRTKGTNPALDLVKLQVYYEEFNYEKVEEIASYTQSSMLSDLGGSVGFYLGVSIIAMFEFLELFIDLLILMAEKKFHGKNRVQSTNIQPAKMEY